MSSEESKVKGVKAVKFDDHLLMGLFVGIVIGLHYGASLSAFMPLFLGAAVLYALRYVKIR